MFEEKQLTGANISKVLLNIMYDVGVPIKTIVGVVAQSYDGADSKASECLGVAAVVKNVTSLADYFLNPCME